MFQFGAIVIKYQVKYRIKIGPAIIAQRLEFIRQSEYKMASDKKIIKGFFKSRQVSH